MTIQILRRRLGETIFADPPASPPEARGGPKLLILGGLFALAILLQMLRVGWSQSLDSLWAEDGPIYLSGAIHESFGGSLLDTYATYLVFVPRAIAELADLFPLEAAPAAIAVLAAAVVALSGLFVWHASAGLVADPYLRGGLVLATVLTPVGGLESTVSAAYVPWYMLVAAFWILLWRPATVAAAAAAGAFVLLTGLSTPGLWFFLPLALLRTLAVRDRRDGLVLAGYWTGAAVQVPVLALNDEPAVAPAWTHDIWIAYLQRVVDGAALGLRLGGEAWAHLGWPLLAAITVAGLAAVAYGAFRADLSGRLLAAIALPTSLAMFVVSVYQRAVGSEIVWPAGDYGEAAGRYAIVPALLLVSTAVVLVDRNLRREGSRWLGYATVGLIVVAVAASFPVANSEIRGTPSWENALERGAEACTAQGGEETGVETSPPGWGLNVPCADLASFAERPGR